MFILVIVIAVAAYCIGVVSGRAQEINRNVNRAGTAQYNPELAAARAKQDGHNRTRFKLGEHLTLEETELALWRLEGILGAVNENFNDVRRAVGRYGVTDEHNKTS